MDQLKTFNALKRIPIDQMQDLIYDEWISNTESTKSISEFLADYGWTWEEYTGRITKGKD